MGQIFATQFKNLAIGYCASEIQVPFVESMKWVGGRVWWLIKFFKKRCKIPTTLENKTQYCAISVLLARDDIGLMWIMEKMVEYIGNQRGEEWQFINRQLKAKGCQNVANAFIRVCFSPWLNSKFSKFLPNVPPSDISDLIYGALLNAA